MFKITSSRKPRSAEGKGQRDISANLAALLCCLALSYMCNIGPNYVIAGEGQKSRWIQEKVLSLWLACGAWQTSTERRKRLVAGDGCVKERASMIRTPSRTEQTTCQKQQQQNKLRATSRYDSNSERRLATARMRTFIEIVANPMITVSCVGSLQTHRLVRVEPMQNVFSGRWQSDSEK